MKLEDWNERGLTFHAWSDRVRELNKWTKARLAAHVREFGTIVWTAAPLEKWSKDELVKEVLRLDFPPDGHPPDEVMAAVRAGSR